MRRTRVITRKTNIFLRSSALRRAGRLAPFRRRDEGSTAKRVRRLCWREPAKSNSNFLLCVLTATRISGGKRTSRVGDGVAQNYRFGNILHRLPALLALALQHQISFALADP